MKIRKKDNGMALVITLMILVLICIIVAGITQTIRLERSAANSHLEKIRAEQLSQMALENVRALLQKETADPGRNWISQPGRLVIAPQGSTNHQVSQVVELSSGDGSTVSANGVFSPAQVNVPIFREAGNFLIANPSTPGGDAPIMPLKWIYLRKDGSTDTNATPASTDKANPLVGRYAFWVDDESSKVNYNTAWTRDAANPASIGHQSRVSLTAFPDFTESMATAIHNFITADNYATINNRFFNSPEDARLLEPTVPGLSDLLRKNKFDITHYNSDPDTTFFNEPRIVLTTRKSKAGGRPFLDIAKVAESDLADISDISEEGLNTTLNLLTKYLKRADWPVAPNSSFQAKYYQGNEDRLTQLALNIIDYVRSKESERPLVIPLRGERASNGKFSIGVVSTPNSFIGMARGPRITEMGVWIPATPDTTGAYAGKLVFELYLPQKFGIPEMDLTQLRVNFSGVPNGGATKFDNGSTEPFIKATQVSGITDARHFKKGEYAVVTLPISITGISSRAAVTEVKLRLAISYNNARLDLAPLLGTSASYPTTTVDAPSVAAGNISSIETDDPRVNSHKDNWVLSSGKNTFGARNSISTIGKEPSATVTPEQDTDALGFISDASLYMPPPRKSAENLEGLVTSTGELGFIHTGMESSAKSGVPWRTMRLQPNKEATTVVPDWAFMDLFAVPDSVPSAAREIFSPHSTSTGGRVNVNAAVEPFHIPRISPVTAAFLGARKNANSSATISFSEAGEFAESIQNRVLAAKGKQYGFQEGFDSPGEIVEIKGVADGGEESEELVRQVGNILTTRGNVFSVYAIGQALKQTPDGKILVTGEQRQQAMIERYAVTIDDKGTLDPTDDLREIRFQTIFFRNLTP